MTNTRRNLAPPRPQPDGWTVSTSVHLDGHRTVLEPGVELTVAIPRKHARRCRFVRHVATDAGVTWVDVFDGKAVRSFPVDAVRTVHTSRRMAARGSE